MNPFDNFEEIWCINLDSRIDRWSECQQEFDKLGIKDRVNRFSAIQMKDSRAACSLSHLTLIKMAQQKKLKNILILEDDVSFIDDTIITLEKCFQQINYNWNVFYLGANLHQHLKKISDNVFQLKRAYAAHAIVYNKNIYDVIIKNYEWKSEIKELPDMFDVWMTCIQDMYNVVICNPMICIQRPSYSDLEKKETDYIFIEKKSKKFMKS